MQLKKLKEKIKANGFKLEFIANKLEINPNTLSKKLKGFNDFNWSEVEILSLLLNLSDNDKLEIFFTNDILEN